MSAMTITQGQMLSRYCPAKRTNAQIAQLEAEARRILARSESTRHGPGTLTDAQRARLGVLRSELQALRRGADN